MPPNDDGEHVDLRQVELARRLLALKETLRRYFARNNVPADEQDDLVQEIFVRIASGEAIGRYDNIDAYIIRTAASVLIDRHRRRKARHADSHLAFDADVHADATLPPDQEVMARQALQRTSLLLMELPEHIRFVFVLRRIEGLPNREIAIRLGISLSSVEKYMARAMRYLIANVGDVR